MSHRARLLATLLAAALLGAAPIGPAAARPAPATPAAAASPEGHYRSPSGRHKLFVRGPAAALTAAGARVVHDYGSFAVAEASDAAAGRAAQLGAEVRDEQNLILLNAGALDTTTPAAAALSAEAGSFEGRRLRLVQFAGPVAPEWYKDLAGTGARIVAYIPSNAYLVYGDAAALARVGAMARGAAFVQWEGAYLPEHRVDPALASAKSGAGPLVSIQLVEDPQANAATLALVGSLRTGGARVWGALGYVNVEAPLAPEAVRQVAARPDVVSIQPGAEVRKLDERQDQIVAGNMTGGGPSGPGYLDWLASQGFTQAQFDASGFVVDVTDSGIDNGTQSPNHFGLFTGGAFAGGSRVVYNRVEGTPNPSSTAAGKDGHGTINAHIVGGFVPSSGAPFDAAPHVDAGGYRYGLGVAPFVRLGSSVVFDPDAFTSPSYPNMLSRAYRDGARISSNSWGSSTGGAYTSDSQAYDALVRDSQPAGAAVPAAGNQQMVIIFAAGNNGSGAGTIGSPGSAKNVITVGATEGVQPFGGADGCAVSDTEANSADDMATFSSRGPTTDGRVKPDIVAPGTHITGGVWQAAQSTAGTGAAGGFDGTGVCGGVGSIYFPATQQFYTASSGTSHSTPAVAGGAALVRQYFINQSLTPPSPAMTKAFLMSSAAYVSGAGAGDSLFSSNQGAGRMDLGAAFAAGSRLLRDQAPDDTFTASGQVRTFTGTVADPARPLRITLAWTDVPGSTTGASYVNNLDLEVTVGSTIYRGNVFAGASSVAGGSADTRNNAESVFLPAGTPAGTPFSIRVVAANIAGDGVPNSGGALDQDFALVCANCAESNLAVVGLTSLTLSSENYTPANGSPDPGERVAVTATVENSGAAAAQDVRLSLLATGGVTAPGAAASVATLAAGAQASSPLSFTVDPALACGGDLTVSVQVRVGAGAPQTVATVFATGSRNVVLQQDFDGVAAPALPADWTTSAPAWTTPPVVPWVTVASGADTAPNAAFASDPAFVTDNLLTSPAFVLGAGPNVLTFRHSVDLEAGATGFDGTVLEISVDGGAFADILAAGGSFTAGGYNKTIDTRFSSPIQGRQAWSGSTGGLKTVEVALPAAAAGKSVALRWRTATDTSDAATGYTLDSVSVVSGRLCATTPTALALRGPAPQSALPGAAFASPIVAVALDESGSPVPGAVVTFTAPASGASGTFQSTGTNVETVTADASGVATSSTFTAGAAVGRYGVAITSGSASAEGRLANGSFVALPLVVR